MMKPPRQLIFALLIPIVALGGLVGYKSYRVHAGQEFTLPIRGFDPRDLLSGHFLIYQIDYGVASICHETPWDRTAPAYICLAPRAFSYEPPENCAAMIKGECQGTRRFAAGVERFFVPEEDARSLENAVRGRQGSIVLSVSRSGTPMIKELLIEGVPWRDYMRGLDATRDAEKRAERDK